jgi:hypothetical protein
MTNASNVALATVASFMALLHVGCASLISGGALLDYATTEQGARIDAPRSNSLRNVETLINSVTDSSLWNQGEGWEYTWRRYAGNIRTWYGRGSGSGTPSSRLKEGTAWVEVTFPEPRRINRVVVHGYQSETQKYAGVWYAYIQVRDSKDLKGIWKTPARVEQGRIITPGRPLGKVGPVTTFRFNAVNADAVRFVVFSMEDARQTRGEGYFYSYGNELNGIRLVEIEVTGTAGVSSSAPTVAAAPDPDSAAGMLVGDLMAAANTPSPPTDTEPTILPGTLVSNLIGGTELSP